MNCADRYVCKSFPSLSQINSLLVNYSVNIESTGVSVKWSVWVCVVSSVMLTKKSRCATLLGNNNSVDIILVGIFILVF